MKLRAPGLASHFLAIGVLVLAVLDGRAQGLTSPAPTGVNAAFTLLFGDVKAFIAEAAVTVHDRQDKELVNTPMTFQVSQMKIRMDVDMARLKSKDLPAGAAEGLKQMGMDRVISIVLPEKQSSYLIYPGLKSYLQVPMKEEDQVTSTTGFKVQREKVGTETIAGRACTRYRVTVVDAKGRKQEATTWNAEELKDFPVQIQMNDGENLMTMRFSDIKLTAPAPTAFDLPTGYTAYDTPQAMMQAVMARAMQGLGGF